LEHATNKDATSPRLSKGSLVKRIKNVNKLFLLTVVLPTAIGCLYFGLVASDVYVSESRFVVRSPERRSQTSVVGALLQGTGFTKSQDDTYPVIDYIQSRDALNELNQRNYIADAYSNHGDFLSRFNSSLDNSFEALWKYYGKHIVTVELDSTSSIATLTTRAFTAADATKINEKLLEMSENLVNRMNARAATDTVQFSQRQVDAAAKQAKDAAAALASYRNTNTVFDPDKQSALQLQQVSALQAQMLGSQTQLIQLQSISPQNPQIPVLKTQIGALEKQIKDATNGVTGSAASLSNKAASYARLQLDSQFADKQLGSAMAGLDSARAETQRQQLYLERLIQANSPDVAIEPKRLKGIFEVFALGMIVWGVLSLLLAGVREHHD